MKQKKSVDSIIRELYKFIWKTVRLVKNMKKQEYQQNMTILKSLKSETSVENFGSPKNQKHLWSNSWLSEDFESTSQEAETILVNWLNKSSTVNYLSTEESHCSFGLEK